jgi:hypothetical protein
MCLVFYLPALSRIYISYSKRKLRRRYDCTFIILIKFCCFAFIISLLCCVWESTVTHSHWVIKLDFKLCVRMGWFCSARSNCLSNGITLFCISLRQACFTIPSYFKLMALNYYRRAFSVASYLGNLCGVIWHSKNYFYFYRNFWSVKSLILLTIQLFQLSQRETSHQEILLWFLRLVTDLSTLYRYVTSRWRLSPYNSHNVYLNVFWIFKNMNRSYFLL